MEESDLRRTALYLKHLSLGAKMVPFAGWEMPVQYSGIVPEHHAVRRAVGVFDISHMGQFIVSGAAAEGFLNAALTQDVKKLEVGQGQYSLMLNEKGGVVDDLILYRTSEKEYFLVVNASKVQEDWDHLHKLQRLIPEHVDGVKMVNLSAFTSGLAIQGPRSRGVFQKVFGTEAIYPERNRVFVAVEPEGFLWLCGTGYTGEEGFEFFCPDGLAEAYFEKILQAVQAEGGLPCGLGARDTLRLEMAYPLNGNDLTPEHTPLEAGLGSFVALGKGDFSGSAVLLQQKEAGVSRRLTALKMVGACPPPRPHYSVLHQGEVVGEIASGTLSPSLNVGIALAYLPVAPSTLGTELQVDIRGRLFPAQVVKKPFFKHS